MIDFGTVKGQAHFDNLLFTNSQTARSLYALGNQTIATRVSGDPVSANNGLFYIFSDHLGSTSVLATSTGNQVPGSRATYYPFGSPRTAPTQTITDRNFTGQKENLELGLIYFNARYYLPTLARFLTPDTLVPDPANPQQFNRYTYVLNNPLRFVDPSGHFTEGAIATYLFNTYGEGWQDIYQSWKANSEWWAMLLAAKAGDVLFGSVYQHFWNGSSIMPLYYHFSGEGEDVLSGITWSMSPFSIHSTYGDTPFGSAALQDVFQGNAGVVWGGLYQKDANGNIVNVMHRMSVTSVYRYQGSGSGNTLVDNVNGELQEGFLCSMINSATAGFGCAVALPFVGDFINKLVSPDYIAGPGFAIGAQYLSKDDYIFVSAGHVFVYHGVMNLTTMYQVDYMTIHFFGTSGINPFYQLVVDYVYQ